MERKEDNMFQWLSKLGKKKPVPPPPPPEIQYLQELRQLVEEKRTKNEEEFKRRVAKYIRDTAPALYRDHIRPKLADWAERGFTDRDFYFREEKESDVPIGDTDPEVVAVAIANYVGTLGFETSYDDGSLGFSEKDGRHIYFYKVTISWSKPSI